MSVNEYSQVSDSDVTKAINEVEQAVNNALIADEKAVAVSNAAGVTLTAAQIVSGLILRSGAAGVSDTTPTAAAIVAAVPHAAVNQVVDLTIINANTGTLTLVAGSGVTLSGTTTVATVNSRLYKLVLTNVTSGAEAVTLYSVLAGAY